MLSLASEDSSSLLIPTTDRLLKEVKSDKSLSVVSSKGIVSSCNPTRDFCVQSVTKDLTCSNCDLRLHYFATSSGK